MNLKRHGRRARIKLMTRGQRAVDLIVQEPEVGEPSPESSEVWPG